MSFLSRKISLPFFIFLFVSISHISYAFMIDSLSALKGVTAKADSFEVIGDNVVAYGNIFVRKDDVLIYADKAVYNDTNKVMDLSGNVRFVRIVKSRQEIEYWDLRKLENDPDVKIKVVGTVMDPNGRQKLIVDTVTQVVAWQGDKVIADMNTFAFQMSEFESNFAGGSVVGEEAVRKANGDIFLKNVEASPCPSFMEGHSAYSFSSSRVNAYPSGDTASNPARTKLMPSADDYHVWAYNNVMYIGNVPVFWLPVVYKPPKTGLGYWTFTGGWASQYGGFFKNTNTWKIYDSPDLQIKTTNMLDYYFKRGFGFGNYTDIVTPTSKTESFLYMINDQDPNYSVPTSSRFYPLNSLRYDADIRNMTHLTDRLDFRGRFNSLSDIYFLNDYYQSWFFTDPEPPTYANLTYQFDRFAVDVTARPRINSWSPVAQELPTLHLAVPRQEIWKNIYYQGQASAGFYDMKWTDFKNPRPSPLIDPTSYYSGRFDSVNFLYYPLNLKVANIIPRAGMRLTGYTNSSSIPIDNNQLNANLSTQSPEGNSRAKVVNYNNKGGWAGRIIPEFGLNLNTKFSSSWTNVKNAFWKMDGIRHVAQPYVDYTYLQPFGTNRDYIYYFDDIDRIDTQNFSRVGLDNRLQTRRGGWKSSQTYTWATMSNYLDFLFNTDSRVGEPPGVLKNIGDFGTIINITPTEDLTFNLRTLIDGGRLFTGTDMGNVITTLNLGATWKFADGWSINPSWAYTRNNNTNPVVSMGSMMEQIESGTYFQRSFRDTSYLSTKLNFKINDRTTGVFSIGRDFQNGMWPNIGITLSRDLPCNLRLIVGASASEAYNNNGVGTQFWGSLWVNLVFTPSVDFDIKPRSLMPGDALAQPFIN